MCGIAGIYAFAARFSSREEQVVCVKRMTSRIAHRGPDAEDFWAEEKGRCTLGHRRLAIIDVSDAGRQPMHWNGGEWSIAFNGEIYNFQELKAELERAGVEFSGRTDTEVLLAGLAFWGESIFAKLDGMYAFAAFHRPTGELLLARDPFGEKPLYYLTTRDGGLAFASELQCLEDVPGFSPEVSADALSELLMFQYIGAPRTIYQNVFKLPPGHFMKVRGVETKIERFFRFQPGINGFSEAPRAELADELESILVRSLKRRLVSDVPLGAFLSGGVDSSTVCALARRKLGVPLQTFSIGFQDDQASEHEIARQLSKVLGTEHRDQIVSPSAFDFLERAGALLDEPNADSSCLPTYLLAKFAKQNVTVALSGDGGDELFGGYGRYLDAIAEERSMAGQNGPAWSRGSGYYGSNRILIFNPGQLASLFGFVPTGSVNHLKRLIGTVNDRELELLHRLRSSDVDNYMPGAVLPKVDRMSMQHSMEVRTPFLSVDLARFAEKVPSHYLVAEGKGKVLLRDVAYRYLPREIMDLPKKGFGLPLTPGWGQSQLIDALKLSLSKNSVLGDWIGADRVQRFIETQSSHGFSIYQAWAVIMLSNWLAQKPVVMPDKESFASVRETRVASSLSPSAGSEVRLLGRIAPQVIIVSPKGYPSTSIIDDLYQQLRNSDFLKLWSIAKAIDLDLFSLNTSQPVRPILLDASKELPALISEAQIDLEGCVLISLDPDSEWIGLRDLEYLKSRRLKELYVPARFRNDGHWQAYKFVYGSRWTMFWNFARVVAASSIRWRQSESLRIKQDHYSSPALPALSTPVDQECSLDFAFFEGHHQLLPYVSSHTEIENSSGRRYSIWNGHVFYRLLSNPQHWYTRVLGKFNWLVPVTAATSPYLPVTSRLLSLADSSTSFVPALRELVSRSNAVNVSNSEPNSVALYTHGLSAGGAERQWCNLAIGLQKTGKRVWLVVDSLERGNGHYLTLARSAGIEVLQIQEESDAILSDFLGHGDQIDLINPDVFPVANNVGKLVSLLKRLAPDALVAQLDWTNITAGTAGLLVGTPQIVFSFRNYNPSNFEYLDAPWLLPAYRELAKSNRIKLTGNSHLGNLDYSSWMEIDPARIKLLQNAFEPDTLMTLSKNEKAAFRLSLDIEPHQKIIVGAFRFAKEKNPHLFVDTCIAILKEQSNTVVLLCGEGEMKSELDKKVSDERLSDRLRFMGRRSDVWKFLSIADVLLLTSDLEGTPNIVREALMQHCPVVSTACGAVPEMIDEGESGHVVPIGDKTALIEKLKLVLSNDQHRHQIIQNLQRAEYAFSPANKAQQLLDIMTGKQ